MGSPSTSDDFPGFDRVYRFTESGASTAFRADLALPDHINPFAPTRHEVHPDAPIVATYQMGRSQPTDVIWTSYAAPVLISERVIAILEHMGARGFGTYEVRLTGRKGEPIPGYRGLSVYGRAGRVDNSRSVETPQEFPGGIVPVWIGLYFDPSSWDGSHFIPEHQGARICVVEEVKRALDEARVKNVEYTKLSEFERSDYEMQLERKREAERASRTAPREGTS